MLIAIVIVVALLVGAGVLAYFKIPAVKKDVLALEARISLLEGATKPSNMHSTVAHVEAKIVAPSLKIVSPVAVATAVEHPVVAAAVKAAVAPVVAAK